MLIWHAAAYLEHHLDHLVGWNDAAHTSPSVFLSARPTACTACAAVPQRLLKRGSYEKGEGVTADNGYGDSWYRGPSWISERQFLHPCVQKNDRCSTRGISKRNRTGITIFYFSHNPSQHTDVWYVNQKEKSDPLGTVGEGSPLLAYGHYLYNSGSPRTPVQLSACCLVLLSMFVARYLLFCSSIYCHCTLPVAVIWPIVLPVCCHLCCLFCIACCLFPLLPPTHGWVTSMNYRAYRQIKSRETWAGLCWKNRNDKGEKVEEASRIVSVVLINQMVTSRQLCFDWWRKR